MSLLLDTHVVLSWLTDDATLSDELKERLAVSRPPLLHRDPFDRMLVAQARCEGLTLVTRDAQIQQYEVELLRV